MDPNETLRKIREAIQQVRVGNDLDAHELAEYVEALDGWLTRGGFLPEPWRSASDGFLPELPEPEVIS